MKNNLTVEEIMELFQALLVVRKFRLKAKKENFTFSNAETVFQEVLSIIKNPQPCPHCGLIISFKIKH